MPREGEKKNEGEKPKGTRVRKVDHYVESGDGTKLDGHGAGSPAGDGEKPTPEGGSEHEPTFVADATPVPDDDSDDGPFGFF